MEVVCHTVKTTKSVCLLHQLCSIIASNWLHSDPIGLEVNPDVKTLF